MAVLLDVTLREAGIANRFSFSLAQVGAIVRALDEAGLDVIEVGYLRPAQSAPTGAACSPEYLDVVRANCVRSSLAVMIHPHEVTLDCYSELASRGFSLVRFAIAPQHAAELVPHAAAARMAGLGFTVNAIRSTEVAPDVLIAAARMAEQLGARCFYIADSNGSMYPDRMSALAAQLRASTSIPLGLHAHDNLRLAFANALVALGAGFEWLDASLGGAGKGGGNLITELIAGHLAVHDGRSVDVFALAEAYAAHVAPTMSGEGFRDVCTPVFGLLDLNIDRIGQIVRESEQRRVPVEDLVATLYRERVNGLAPARH